MPPTPRRAKPRPPDRIPRETIRLRYGKRMLRHGLALGWRAEWDGDPFPVTVTRKGAVSTFPVATSIPNRKAA